MVIYDDKIQSDYTQLTSTIDNVKVYAAGATVTWITELRLSAGEVSDKFLLAFNKLRHLIKIDIANCLSREALIEVRERLPIPDENAKVEVQIDRVLPNWEKYEQEERGKPIRGGYRWRVRVPAGGQTALSVQYTVKTFVDSELIGGNRRE